VQLLDQLQRPLAALYMTGARWRCQSGAAGAGADRVVLPNSGRILFSTNIAIWETLLILTAVFTSILDI